jgi:glycosyltransferase involved in cell wall biosynthesis
VSDAGGAAELVDGTCGVLTNCGDAAAVAQAMGRLAADPAQRREMGRAAAARARALVDPAQRLTQLHSLFSGQPAHAG